MNNDIIIEREFISCPICQKDKYEILFERKQKIFTKLGIACFEVIDGICKSCGCVYQNPRPSQEQLDLYYKNKFLHTFGQPDYNITARKKAFNSIVKSPSKVFEIGAGEGEFLIELEKLGHQVYGYEPSANTTKQKFALKNNNPPYDVIINNHVIEHIADLDGFFNYLRNILKIGGIIYFEVPNLHFYKSSSWSIYHEHLIHFTPQNLIYLLNRHGLETNALEFKNITRDIGFGIFAINTGETVIMNLPDEYIINKSYMIPCLERFEKRKYLQKIQLDRLLSNSDHSVVLWGANIFSLDLLTTLNPKELKRIIIVDNSKEKVNNRFFPKYFVPIIGPEKLKKGTKASFLICAVNWKEEIINEIRSLGFNQSEIDSLVI